MKKTAVLFPGQGSQYLGMGREFLEVDGAARDLMDMAEKRSGVALAKLCLDGPMEDLTRVFHLQPAITAINLICWQALTRALPDFRPAFFAGHSLGEYSALCGAGVVSSQDCLALVTRRGELMEREGAERPGGMRAVLGLTVEEVESLLEDFTGGMVVIANHNSERQVVISGDLTGLEGFSGVCSRNGAKVVPLNVSAANHSPLLAGAVEDFAAFLRNFDFNRPSVPVVFNVTAEREEDSAAIRSIMARQIATRVRWYESVNLMLREGVELFIEVGPGKVLSGLMRKIIPRGTAAACIQFDTPEGLVKVVEAVKN
ncbi:MAG: ACP S-malonyltransferase [Desulfobulbaceae bacterium]|jgi:[acyl-carrier-protein] S-malonyltransferase|nr:ACP S-malonyltransferase [Desulfobulbaceae bacterium]